MVLLVLLPMVLLMVLMAMVGVREQGELQAGAVRRYG